MVELLAKSGDPDQTPHSAASDLGLHYLPVTRLGSTVFNGLKAPYVFKIDILLSKKVLMN